MQMVTVTIDGTTVSVEQHTPIVEAAKQFGIRIPTFCYQARLSGQASCRVCLVEIEGQRKLQPSCVTPVLEGMVINTSSPVVMQARRAMLEFLLANHPLDCPICDKGGECELQDMVFEYGPRETRFGEQKWTFHTQDYALNQVIIKNSNRCVQCQRCVRMCEEIVGATALGAIGRGTNTEETAFARSLENCDHCGNCVEVCPVGSFMSLPYRYKARIWDLTEVNTVCPYCGTGCQLTVGLRDGELMRVVSKQNSGINKETLCVRGRFGLDFVTGDKRIREPMLRRNGTLETVSWEEMEDHLGSRLEEALGKGKVAGALASPRLTNEELFALQKLMRAVFKTNSIDSTSRWFGSRATPSRIYDIIGRMVRHSYTRRPLTEVLDADCVLVIGGSVTEENPVTDYTIRNALSRKPIDLFILSARPSRLDSIARSFARCLPGQEAFVLSLIVREALEGEQHGKALGKAFPNLGIFKKGLAGLKKSSLPSVAGFLDQLEPRLAGAESVSILLGTDIPRSSDALSSLHAIDNLVRVLEVSGKKVALQFLFDRCNQLGAWDMGATPFMLPGYRPVADDHGRAYFEEKWNTELPSKPGADFKRMLGHCDAGEMGLLYVVGEDPLLACAGGKDVEKALSKAGLLIVQDAFMTETASLADIVLPGCTFAENHGTRTNNEGRVQRVRAFKDPPFEARRDLDIFALLASIMGHGEGFSSAEGTFAEIADAVPSYGGLCLDDLGADGAFGRPGEGPATGPLFDPEVTSPRTRPGSMLISGNCLFHSGYVSRHSRILRTISDQPYAEMCEEDARELGLENGSPVTLKANGHKIKVTLKINESFPRNVVFVPENFDSVRLNQLLSNSEYPCMVEITNE